MEKIVYEQVQVYFDSNKLNTDFQHAYRHGHSAFDVIDPLLLLNKLKAYGFCATALRWMETYLTTRGQLVFFNGSFSNIHQINCGVPHGSCLGPLLFSIFINDLPLVLDQTKMAIYADDSTLWSADPLINNINIILDRELQWVANWVSDNKLVLNIAKTKSILIGSKHQLEAKPKLNLFIDNIHIEQVNEVKLLGITIDSALSWSKHIDNIVRRMGRGVAMVRRVSRYMTVEIRRQVLSAIVLSLLDYCFIVWSSTSKGDLEKLQKAQNKAARCALNCNYRTNISLMHIRLRWLTVCQRVSYVLLNFVRNLKALQAPCVLYRKLSSHYAQHDYSTRHATEERFILPCVNSGTIQKSVMYRAIVLWNEMP